MRCLTSLYCKTEVLHIESFLDVTSLFYYISSYIHKPFKSDEIIQESRIYRLVSAHFKPFKRLKSIYLSGIVIESLNEDVFKYLPYLEKLELTQCNIRFVNSEILKYLTELEDLTLEFITFHEFNLNYLVKLKWLKLTNCGISDLKENTLEDLKELSSIYLKKLNLNCIEPRCFKNLNELRSIIIYKCKVKVLNQEILMGLNNLYVFSIDVRNDFAVSQNITFEKDWSKVLRNLESLELIGCDFTMLKEILNSHSNLVSLNIGFNKNISLENGCFLESKKLRYLSLEACGIKKVNAEMFAGLEGLRTLVLEENSVCLEEGCFSYLKSLKKLNLSKCCLKFLAKNMFDGLEKLEHLNISFNKIISVESGCLDHMTKLENYKDIFQDLKWQFERYRNIFD